MDLNIDNFINELVNYNGKSRPSEADVRALCFKAREILLDQPIVLELVAPVKICGNIRFYKGDIHGQFSDLLRLF